ncbi:MAG: tetratricopeptide repeat protein [Methanothrix sp.]|nr:MAG: tetratricopeptide repeat protein [Methanothrix sp.]
MRIFLSYGHDEHAPLAEQIKKDLIARGHDVWFDLDRLKPGGDWENYIEEGLEWVSSNHTQGRIILLMTPHSIRRPDGYCLNEIALALSRRLDIIPIMVVWSEPPLSIYRIQWLDMKDCVPIQQRAEKYEIKFEQLIEALEYNRLDFEGTQARLIKMLDPLPFDADILIHLPQFTGRQWIFLDIDNWLSDPQAQRIFWIIGKPGVGKTALSAWLCHHRREIVAFHFCRHGHTQKSDQKKCVLSIAYQLSSQLPDYQTRLKSLALEEIISKSDAKTLFDMLIVQPLSGNFPKPDRKIVILIDALDEANKGQTNDLAAFIASEFKKTPDWLRLIITSRNDPVVKFWFQDIDPYCLDDYVQKNESDIREYLFRELKPFFKEMEMLVNTIITKSEGNFLYAQYLCRELAIRRISVDQINNFPKGLGAIYAQFFEREYPVKDEDKRPGGSDIDFYKENCRHVLETVAAACEPLNIENIASIIGCNDDYQLNEIINSFGSLFLQVDDIIRPFHISVMEWLTSRNFAGPYFISESQGHILLADYGWQEYKQDHANMSGYTQAHLPTHLLKTKRFEDLINLLNNQEYFEKLWYSNEFFVKEIWTNIENNSRFRLLGVYRPVIDNPAQHHGKFINCVALLLSDTGYSLESKSLWEYLVGFYRRKREYQNLQSVLSDFAWSLDLRGEPDRAMELYKEQEQICKEIMNKKGLQISLVRQANIYHDMGKLDLAMELYKEQEQICKELKDNYWLQKSLGNQGIIHDIRGELDKAMELYKEQERICEEIGNWDGFQKCLGHQGNIHYTKDNLEKALELYQKQEQICKKISHKRGLQYALGSQAMIFHSRGNLATAMECYKRQENICLEIDNKDGLQASLGNQGVIYEEWDELDEAMKLYDEQERICKSIHKLEGIQIAIGHRANIYFDRNELDRAKELYNEQLKICREMENKDGIQKILGNLAIIYHIRGDLDTALKLYEEQERICREIENKKDLAKSLIHQAYLLVNDPLQRQTALSIAEEANQYAIENNNTFLANYILPKLEFIREMQKKDG